MDVEEVAEELYRLKPAEFVAARDAYVARAWKDKDAAAAREITSLGSQEYSPRNNGVAPDLDRCL
ncbi:hypothetical protein [Streptomyces sp. WAC01280]|uniref:hypothetical protein n=1 Tax=Streptomyces sp. WAC01280 TaxID=2487424 RepID=UPI000F7AF334|nr:hypothetical protein [Streptomyces sp. WAC01280]RSS57481.1 hypothetical protein EF909_16190 [Streptomyces sp. WAC01280]